MAAPKIPPKVKKPAEIADRTQRPVIAELIRPTVPALSGKAKVSKHLIDALFATTDTIKHYRGQLDLNLYGVRDLEKTKENLSAVIASGFRGMELITWENRTLKGIFSLFDKLGASEDEPFIVLENRRPLYEEVLEKKVTKKNKEGYIFKDFSGAEIAEVDKAIDTLSRNPQQIIVKGLDGYDKNKKPLFFFAMTEKAILAVEYLKRKISEDEAGGLTEQGLKETAQIKIGMLPIFLKHLHKYFRYLPKDISKEIRAVCPEVRKVSRGLCKFIDWLHRHDALKVSRSRPALLAELHLEKEYQEHKGRTIKTLLDWYEIAKRTGYLKSYALDQRGAHELQDILCLNEEKYYHHRIRQARLAKAKTKPKGLLNA